MVKTLQKKFIFAAMLAVSILLIIMVGAINAANYWMNDSQTSQRLHMLMSNELRIVQRDTLNRRIHLFDRPMDEDTVMSLRFFTVHVGGDGEVVHVDVSRISSVSEEQAGSYALDAVAKKRETGYMNSFKYCVAEVDNQKGFAKSSGKAIVFLDISGQRQSIMTVLVSSVLILAVCWLLMFLLVALLSKKAIAPLAANIEKQKQFVTDAGHEIKTPLAIIQANVDAMELINGENKYSKNIRAQTLRLSGLMQTLLTLARMEESDILISSEDILVDELTAETLQPFYESAALRGIQIETDLQPQVTVHSDRERLQRLLSILFDNAVKYTDSDGIIFVSLRKREKSVVFQVKNSCRNLPEGNPDKLFDRFYRGDSARTQKGGGYGIGLSAARAIAATLKCSISASYENKNMIVFTVKI